MERKSNAWCLHGWVILERGQTMAHSLLVLVSIWRLYPSLLSSFMTCPFLFVPTLEWCSLMFCWLVNCIHPCTIRLWVPHSYSLLYFTIHSSNYRILLFSIERLAITSCYYYVSTLAKLTVTGLLRRGIWVYEHLAKFLEFGGSANFFCKEWELDNMEELVVELMCFCEILLLHLVSNVAMFAV